MPSPRLGRSRESIVSTLFAAAALLPLAAHDATEASALRLRLSSASPAQLRAAPVGDPVALEIDLPTLDPATTEAYLHAIDDRRRGLGLVFAIAGDVREGAAIVALSCDGLMLLPGGRLTGATDAWCESVSLREDLAADLAQLGRLDKTLTGRFVASGGHLGWNSSGGFTTRQGAEATLALAGQAAVLDSPFLRRTAMVFGNAGSFDAAFREIDEGRGRARPSAPGFAAPSVVPPTPPAAPGGPAIPASSPTAPSNSPRVPTAPPPTTPHPPKVAPIVAEYRGTLADFQRELRDFEGYYSGREGVWTARRGLRAVWLAGNGQTRNAKTSTACERAQRDLKSMLDRMRRNRSTALKLTDNPGHPDILRMEEHKIVLEQVFEALDDNDASLFDSVYQKALRLEMPGATP